MARIALVSERFDEEEPLDAHSRAAIEAAERVSPSVAAVEVFRGGRARGSGSAVAITPGDGVEIVEVVEGSPAAAAGLRPGDILVAIDGDHVAGPEDIQRKMLADAIGTPTRIELVRNGETLVVDAVPRELVFGE